MTLTRNPSAFVYAVHIRQPAARIPQSLARTGLDYPVAKAEVCVLERGIAVERGRVHLSHDLPSLMACDLLEEMCDYG